MTHINQYQDSQWLLDLGQGSPDAFKNIYEAYQRPLFSFAFYLTKSKDISEEVLQEVFIKLWEKRAQFPPDISLFPYLKKMTQNQVLDLFKKANRDRAFQKRLAEALQTASLMGNDTAWEKELSGVYQDAIRNLSPQQRLIYSLHRNQDLTYQEIADQLGLSRNTVRNHMLGAIKSVRSYVSGHTDLACLILAICAGQSSH